MLEHGTIRIANMIQALADHIDQLDLALDQLAMRDRNFDRFALMLIDNVVELALHTHAQDTAAQNKGWSKAEAPKFDPKAVAEATGQHFEAKAKLAKLTGMVTADLADSVMRLHAFRNTAYHAGARHEGILHSLALFYFQNACTILANYRPTVWTSRRTDKISHRAMKYLGVPGVMEQEATLKSAWERLRTIAGAMGDSLVADLHTDMAKTIQASEQDIGFVTENSRPAMSRKQVIIECQAWHTAFTEEGKRFAAEHGCPETTVGGHVEWLAANFPWPVKDDPTESWRKRLVRLETERNQHLALKKYCDFMNQSQDIRERIEAFAAGLDADIQLQIDIARGK
jgi:hypothetical protein